MDNEFADISVNFNDSYNPTIQSPNCQFPLQFYQTRETLVDVENYKKFIENTISRFRHSRCYKSYKSYLYDLGLNHCMIMSNIDTEKADIEMHHAFLTIYDIAILITEHLINTVGYTCSFQVCQLLKEEHKNNNIPIVMLSKTAHQLVHNSPDMFIPANLVFGYWIDLIQKYNRGITIDIANKIIMFIQRSIELNNQGSNYTSNLLALRDNIVDWSIYNEYGGKLLPGEIVY